MKEYILTEEDLSSMQLLLIDSFKELVRCKYCKYNKRGICWWLNLSLVVDDDDYCSCAERKEE